MRTVLRFFPLTLSLILLVSLPVTAGQLQLRGKLECLGSSGPVELKYPCPEGSHMSFLTEGGKLYHFAAKDPRAAIFFDPRVREEKLQITAEADGEGALSLVSVLIVRNGQLVQPYYYCPICNITSYAPGPCWCCQREFEYREKKVPEPGSKDSFQ